MTSLNVSLFTRPTGAQLGTYMSGLDGYYCDNFLELLYGRQRPCKSSLIKMEFRPINTAYGIT